jgi:hypothetical protein
VTGIMGYMQVEIYEDKDHAREDEIAALGGQGVGQNYFTSFYERFKEVRIVVKVLVFVGQYVTVISSRVLRTFGFVFGEVGISRTCFVHV